MSTHKKKASLGRGLEALLGSAAAANATPPASTQPTSEAPTVATTPSAPSPAVDNQLKTVGVDQLQRGRFQPRVDMRKEALQGLADSIAEQGIVQPIVVRAISAGKVPYEIIAGERRWRAAQMAGLHEVPVVVKTLDDQATLAVALIENIQREDLNPIEEARALQRLAEEFDLSHEEVANTVGRSRSGVTNLIRLLGLSTEVQQALIEQKLNMGHARALLSLPSREQMQLANKSIKQGWSVRQMEQAVRQHGRKDSASSGAPARVSKSLEIRHLEKEVSESLAAKVDIQHRHNNKGQVVIHYDSLDALQGILKKIKA